MINTCISSNLYTGIGECKYEQFYSSMIGCIWYSLVEAYPRFTVCMSLISIAIMAYVAVNTLKIFYNWAGFHKILVICSAIVLHNLEFKAAAIGVLAFTCMGALNSKVYLCILHKFS